MTDTRFRLGRLPLALWLAASCTGTVDQNAPVAPGGTPTSPADGTPTKPSTPGAPTTPGGTTTPGMPGGMATPAPTTPGSTTTPEPTKPTETTPVAVAVACPKAGTTIEPTTLSRTFQQSCAGCHGASGGGIGKIPAIPGTVVDFAKFREIVRAGQK